MAHSPAPFHEALGLGRLKLRPDGSGAMASDAEELPECTDKAPKTTRHDDGRPVAGYEDAHRGSKCDCKDTGQPDTCPEQNDRLGFCALAVPDGNAI